MTDPRWACQTGPVDLPPASDDQTAGAPHGAAGTAATPWTGATAPGTVLAGRYVVGRLIGRGGMSDVFEATDQRTGLTVAVKVVRSGDPEFARRLAQEAQALRRFEHPGLIPLLDTGTEGDLAYLVMEFVQGHSLNVVLRGGAMGAAATAALGAAVADALAYVHGRGVIHRDVKPANVMVRPDGRTLLGDFGIARLVDGSTLTITGTTLGTAAYMAPEQLEDHQVGPEADIWSLGMVLLECLTGHRVYQGPAAEVIARRLAGPVPMPVGLPVPWKLLLSGTLDHRPDQRLRALEVSTLLGAAAFDTKWAPTTADPLAQDGTQPYDLTALARTGARTGAGTGTEALAGTRTEVAGAAGGTAVIPPGLVPPAAIPAPVTPARRGRWPLAVLAVLLAVGLASGLAYALSSGTAAPPRTTTTTTTTAATTTTTPPTTTTSVARSAPQALAALVGDIASGVTTGTVDGAVGQTISNEAQQAITDEAAGHTNQAAADLQQAAMAIAGGVSNGKISQSAGQLLQNDLSALGSALGLSAAAAAPTTTTTTTAPPPPAGGHGHNG